MAGNSQVLVDEEQTLNYILSPMIKIIVGENEASKPFFVHEDLLTSRSCFFRKALKAYGEDGNLAWLEGEDGTVKLPEDEPEVFAAYVQLLYQGKLPIGKSVPDAESKEGKALADAVLAVVKEQHALLSKLYILCEKLQDITGKGLVITAFVETANKKWMDNNQWYPLAESIRTIYKGTIDGDPLRKFFVDCWVLLADSNWFGDRGVEDYPHQFTFEVMMGMMKERKRPEDSQRIQDASNYSKKLRNADELDGEHLLGSSEASS